MPETSRVGSIGRLLLQASPELPIDSSGPFPDFEVNFISVDSAQVLTVESTTARAGLSETATFRRMGHFGPEDSQLQGLRSGNIFEDALGRRCMIQLQSFEEEVTSPRKEIHYGRVVNRSLERFSDREDVIFTSRLDHSMIGDPVQGMSTQRFAGSRQIFIPPAELLGAHVKQSTVGGDIVFNPIVDGIVIPNRSWWPTSIENAIPFFVDPNQIPREFWTAGYGAPQPGSGFFGWINQVRRVLDFRKYGMDYWNVISAIYYLTWTLNPDEKHIGNPPDIRSILPELLVEDERLILHSVLIPQGTSLVDALRMICIPYGIDFKIEHYKAGRRRFKFWEIPGFQLFDLPVSEIGSVMDLRTDAVANINSSIDTVDQVANEVQVIGSIPKFEITLPLFPAWDPKLDKSHRKDLTIGSSESEENPRLFREWVANENGEYSFDRIWFPFIGGPVGGGRESPIVPDLETIFAFEAQRVLSGFVRRIVDLLPWILKWDIQLPYVQRRRRALPTLSSFKNGTPIGTIRGVDIQFAFNKREGSMGRLWPPIGSEWRALSWKPIQEMTDRVDVLQNEIGFRFTGRLLPSELFGRTALSGSVLPGPGSSEDPISINRIGLNEDLYFRITCTVEADGPIAFRASQFPPESRIDIDPHVHVIKFKERFGVALRKESGPYRSRFDEENSALRSRDDISQMVVLANTTLSRWASNRASGHVTISHIDWWPKSVDCILGSNITGASSRRISFKTTVLGDLIDDENMYPMVVGKSLDFVNQTQVLTLDQFRKKGEA